MSTPEARESSMLASHSPAWSCYYIYCRCLTSRVTSSIACENEAPNRHQSEHHAPPNSCVNTDLPV
eukprot:6174996-Pleurochrysis_carterae.AAC.1